VDQPIHKHLERGETLGRMPNRRPFAHTWHVHHGQVGTEILLPVTPEYPECSSRKSAWRTSPEQRCRLWIRRQSREETKRNGQSHWRARWRHYGPLPRAQAKKDVEKRVVGVVGEQPHLPRK
jgi:hypothetical protein